MSARSRGQAGGSRRLARIGLPALSLLLFLLAAPVYALIRLADEVDWRLLALWPLLASAVTYFAYRSDKRRAEAGARRIPEWTLHAAEMAGGWPGAFLAQRRLRHKISKLSYQVSFWMVVLFHQLVALDVSTGWKITKRALGIISFQTP